MEISTMPTAVSHPSYIINYTSGTILASLQANSSRSHLLTIITHTSAHPPIAGQNIEQGSKVSLNDDIDDEDDDSFGEHYFHICIYIWACVVISSLIALSVKWGCCGRSLTRWEVKRIPLKRFQRVEGEDSQEKCPICHEEFHEERLIRQLPCNHCYHSYCVDRWLVKMSNRCPLCKQRVSISLLCPWNKQRWKREINGHLSADMEASVDESPPLPPLATLTPSNWYGEEIMSGPSKFIIMRPGRPTRVIDVREKKKSSVSHKNSPDKEAVTFQPSDINMASCKCQHFDDTLAEHSCKTDVCEISRTGITAESVVSVATLFEPNDILGADVQATSARSSRSCSISSDQPLLFQNHCNVGDEQESRDSDDLIHETPNWGISLTPLVHSREGSSSAPGCTHELVCKSLPRMKEAEHKKTAKAIVKLSSSIVSCNTKASDTKTKLLTPSTSNSQIFTKHSAISAQLDWSYCIPDSRFHIPARYNKHHTLPGNSTESRALLEFNPSNVSDNCIHEKFRKSAAVSEKKNNA